MQPIKWSFSGLKQYINCPKQYHEIKVLNNYAIRETEQMRYGTEVHKALEDYVADGVVLPLNYQRFKALVDPLLEIEGTKIAEHKMALDYNRKPCDFNAPEYWVRGIADLLILSDDTAFIVDYKTGSNKYPDVKQLKLMALMTFAHFPEIQRIKAGLMFVMHNSFIDEEYQRKDAESLWGNFKNDLERMKLSYETDTWHPNATPLCRWCPVRACEFNKE